MLEALLVALAGEEHLQYLYCSSLDLKMSTDWIYKVTLAECCVN